MSSIGKLDFGHIAQTSLAHVLFTIEHRKRVKQHLSCFTISWKNIDKFFSLQHVPLRAALLGLGGWGYSS